MQVNITIDSASVLNPLKELGQDRQGPFILSKSLNLLARKVQDNLREDIRQTLHVRRWSWVKNSVKIDKGTWSTKTRLWVKIYLTEAASFIGAMEDGAQHLPRNGHQFLCVPNEAVFGGKIIEAANPLYVKNLHLTEAKGHILKGEQRTFMVDSKKTGNPLILQRVGNEARGKAKRGTSKASGLRMLYVLLKATKRPQRIHWATTANATVANESTGIFTEVMRDALATARKN